jgi:hypothetical protein
MSGWDQGNVFYHNPNGEPMDESSDNANPTVAQAKFLKFIRNFLDGNAYVYRFSHSQSLTLSSSSLSIFIVMFTLTISIRTHDHNYHNHTIQKISIHLSHTYLNKFQRPASTKVQPATILLRSKYGRFAFL